MIRYVAIVTLHVANHQNIFNFIKGLIFPSIIFITELKEFYVIFFILTLEQIIVLNKYAPKTNLFPKYRVSQKSRPLFDALYLKIYDHIIAKRKYFRIEYPFTIFMIPNMTPLMTSWPIYPN